MTTSLLDVYGILNTLSHYLAFPVAASYCYPVFSIRIHHVLGPLIPWSSQFINCNTIQKVRKHIYFQPIPVIPLSLRAPCDTRMTHWSRKCCRCAKDSQVGAGLSLREKRTGTGERPRSSGALFWGALVPRARRATWLPCASRSSHISRMARMARSSLDAPSSRYS